MAESVQTAIYQLQMDSSQFKSDGAAVQTVTAKIGNEFEKLEAKLDRNVAIEIRRRNAIEQVNRVAEEEGIENMRRAALIDQVNAKYDQQAAAIQRVNGVAANSNRIINTASGAYSQFGGRLQNSAFQVADFFVQVEAGTPIMRAATQQGSQFLGAFGPYGAVLGAAAAVIGIVLTKMDLLGQSAKDAKSAQDDFKDALDAANKVLLTSDERAQQAADANLYLAKTAADAAIATNQLAVAEATRLAQEQKLRGMAPRGTGQGERPFALDMDAQLQMLQRQLELSIELREKLNDPANLGSNREAGAKAAEDAEKEREKELEATIKAMGGVEAYIESMREEQRQLQMSEKERAIRIASLRAEAIEGDHRIPGMEEYLDQVRREAGLLYDVQQAQKAKEEAAKEAQREAEKAAREQERMLQHAADVIGDQVSALTQAALGWEDWRDVAKQAINVVINELSKLSSLGGSGGGLFDLLLGIGTAALGGAAGGIGGGSVIGGPGFGTARAEGGPVEAGKVYTVGERGPETFIPRVSGHIAANGNRSSNVTVVQNFDFRNAIVDTAKIRGEIAKTTPQTVAAVRADISDQKRRGGLAAFR